MVSLSENGHHAARHSPGLFLHVRIVYQANAAARAMAAVKAPYRMAKDMLSCGSVRSRLVSLAAVMFLMMIVRLTGGDFWARNRNVTLVGLVASLTPTTRRPVSGRVIPARVAGVLHLELVFVVIVHPGRNVISPCPLILVELCLALNVAPGSLHCT